MKNAVLREVDIIIQEHTQRYRLVGLGENNFQDSDLQVDEILEKKRACVGESSWGKFAGAYAEEEERQLVVLYVRLGLAATLVSTSDQPPKNH